MRKIFLTLLFTIFAIGQNDFLPPEEAFKITTTKSDDKLTYNIKLADEIYLYRDKLKVIITKPKTIDLTKSLQLREALFHHETYVYFDSITIDITKEMLENAIKADEYEVMLKYQGCSNAGLCYQPLRVKEKISFAGKTQDTKVEEKEISEADTITQTLSEGSILLILVTFFGFGLLLSLTPCVFPMIPILSSIIVSHSNNGKEMSAKKGLGVSIVYVLAMSLAYTIAGILAGLFGSNLQASLQNPIVLTIFAGIFVVLAFSMFGYFKIELPQSLQNRLNNTATGKDKKGYTGIAIMGFLSALIVGPCVAPPLAGALVYIGQTGDAILGGLALFVMSLGMGLPLLVVGAGAGKFMPKPGGWMESVSKAFGVIMLGVAIWMIERIIPALYTMVLWSLLFIGTSAYLLLKRTKVATIFAIIFFALGFILALGAGSGAKNPLNPLEYLGKNKSEIKKGGLQFQKVKTLAELDKIVATSDKPIMLDFYADWCISCKELEETTFKDKRVIEALKGHHLLKVDTTANSDEDKKLLERFNLFGPPGIIFWKNGVEVKSAKIIGYKNGDEFLAHLEKNRL